MLVNGLFAYMMLYFICSFAPGLSRSPVWATLLKPTGPETTQKQAKTKQPYPNPPPTHPKTNLGVVWGWFLGCFVGSLRGFVCFGEFWHPVGFNRHPLMLLASEM